MTFTDDDLKRLKERLSEQKSGAALIAYGNPPLVFNCAALLTRLEAAEVCLTNAPLKEGGVLNESDVKAWRKACGK